MKKLIYFVAIAALFAACQPNQEVGTPFYAGQKVTLAATMPSDGASQMPGMKRVSGKDAGSKIALFWDANDQVKVTVDGQSAIFTLTEGEGTTSSTFTGIMPADGTSYTVTYPADYNENVLANQTYVENGFGNGLMTFCNLYSETNS